jgi:hypothetical protein
MIVTCPQCGCSWSDPDKLPGMPCGDRLWKFGTTAICDGILASGEGGIGANSFSCMPAVASSTDVSVPNRIREALS